MISLTISRVDVSSPPGVSMRMIAISAPSSVASSRALSIHSDVAGSIVPESSIDLAVPPAPWPSAEATRIATPAVAIAAQSVSRSFVAIGLAGSA